MDTTIEEQRALHEERDRIEMAIVSEMLSKKNGQREKLDSEHRQKALLDRYRKCSKTLLELYEKQFKQPLVPNLETNPFNQFYLGLKKVKDFYERHVNEQLVPMSAEFEEMVAFRGIAADKNVDFNTNQPFADEDNPEDGELESSDGDDDNDNKLDRGNEIKRLAKGLPTEDLVELAVELPKKPAPEESMIKFTDEEGFGRYLDLVECYHIYSQVFKGESTKLDYLNFLDQLDKVAEIPKEKKLSGAYRNYLETILNYFRDYCRRAKPLLVFEELEEDATQDFETNWQSKTVHGWFTDEDRQRKQIDGEAQIDLEQLRSREELLEMGLECLKTELQVRGLKCGGTLEQRAYRLWSVRGKTADKIDVSLRASDIEIFSKKSKKKKSSTNLPKIIAMLESKLLMYAELFAEQRKGTMENVQRRQARTAEERNDDDDVSDIDDDDDDDDADQNDIVYNPKNLPLGWDGKPIPYWLYKLHGLNLTFNCEICGNATYKGPKTFQRHFAEWRHAQGMRALGIPNTTHFANITNIEDAISLWEKLKIERKNEKFHVDSEEEYEDSQGNVLNKKTFEDLKRQGLL